MKSTKWISIFCLTAISLFSCGISPNEETEVDKNKKETSIEQISEGNQNLGWNLLNLETQTTKKAKNVIISPLSIQIALHMAINGAQGKTLEEILAVLGCPNCDPHSINQQTKALVSILTAGKEDPLLEISNGFFYDDKRINLNSGFQNSLVDYDCEFKKADFNEVNPSLSLINNWVKDKTKGKIDKILSEISSEDIAFLINALYYKGSWSEAFPEYLNSESEFVTSEGNKIQSQFIGADKALPNFRDQELMAVDVPFKDSTYSMTFVSFKNETDQPQLNAEKFIQIISKLKLDRAIVSLPKLKVTYENDIIGSLKKLGMKSAFNEAEADFSKMGTSRGKIFINQLKHKTALELDEKGVEGAAVTSIGFGVTSVPEPFNFNRPYYLVLRHIKTNNIVFLGKIDNPNEN